MFSPSQDLASRVQSTRIDGTRSGRVARRICQLGLFAFGPTAVSFFDLGFFTLVSRFVTFSIDFSILAVAVVLAAVLVDPSLFITLSFLFYQSSNVSP